MKQITLEQFLKIAVENEKALALEKEYIEKLVDLAKEEGYEIIFTEKLDDDELDQISGGIITSTIKRIHFNGESKSTAKKGAQLFFI